MDTIWKLFGVHMDTIIDYGDYKTLFGYYIGTIWSLYGLQDTERHEDTIWTVQDTKKHYLDTTWILYGHCRTLYMDTTGH